MKTCSYFVAWCVAIFAPLSPSSAASPVYLVACSPSTQIEPAPYAVLGVDLDTSSLSVVAEIPAKSAGVLTATVDAEHRTVAFWTVERDDSGLVYVIPVDTLEARERFAIPKPSLRGGCFLLRNEQEPTAVSASPLSDGTAYVVQLGHGVQERSPLDVDWLTALYYGSTAWDNIHPYALLRIDPLTGEIAYVCSQGERPVSLRLAPATLEKYRRIRQEGRLGNKALIVINTMDTTVVMIPPVIGAARPSKATYLTRTSAAPELVFTEFPVDGYVQTYLHKFGAWIVIQVSKEEPTDTERGLDVPVMSHVFYDANFKGHGEWMAPKNTELLLVGDDYVLFRTDDKLFKAPFKDGEVGEGKLVCSSPRIRDVHWALPGKPAAQKKE